MKKILYPASLLLLSGMAFLLLSGLVLLLFEPPQTEQVSQIKSDGPTNPGWGEQWTRMKKPINGEIPRRPFAEARAFDETKNKTRANFLLSIQDAGPVSVGGRTRAFVQDWNNTNQLFSAGVSGGVWRSTDRGSSWSPVNDQQSTLSVTGLAQDHFNSDIIYFSTGEPRGNSTGIPGGGVYRSTDNGQSFQLLAATDNGNFDYTWRIRTSPSDSAHVYVAASIDGLWRSTDAGDTWTQVFDQGNDAVNDVEIRPDGSVYITVNTDGVWSSTDGSANSFAKLSNGLPSNGFRRVELAVCDSFPDIIYAGFEDSLASSYRTGLKQIWKTTDAGATWDSLATNPDRDFNVTFSFPWYAFLLEVKPDDPDFLMTGSVNMGYTTNGGNSWDFAAYTHADYHGAWWDKDNPQNCFVGNDGGIHRYSTTNIGITAEDLNDGYRVTQYYTGHFFPAGADFIGGTQDNGTWASRNGNQVFDKLFGGDGAFCAVDQQSPNYSWVSYQRGHIFRADNSASPFPIYVNVENQLDGDNDGSIDDGAWFINPFEINMEDGNQLYFTTYERIWRTSDRGNNWVPITNDISSGSFNPYCIGLSKSTNPIAYIGGESGLFYRIDNAAFTAAGNEVNLGSSVPSNIDSDFLVCAKVHPLDSSVVYVSSSTFSTEPRIWKVTNATSSSPVWTSISGDLPANLPVNWVEVDPQEPDSHLIAATDYGLYVSTNGGQNWEKESDIPNVSIHMLRLRESDLKLHIYTHGRGIWTADLPLIVSNEGPKPSQELSLYPNPSSGIISLQGLEKGISEVRLLDTQGKLILQQRVSPGQPQLDPQNLSQGLYLLEITSPGGVKTLKKIIRN